MPMQHNVNKMSNDGCFILIIRMSVGRPTAPVIRHYNSSKKDVHFNQFFPIIVGHLDTHYTIEFYLQVNGMVF